MLTTLYKVMCRRVIMVVLRLVSMQLYKVRFRAIAYRKGKNLSPRLTVVSNSY